MIVKNVRRGMGLVAVHCAVWNPDNGSRQFLDMMWRSAHWALKREIPPVPADVFTART
jgi:hypothetical protein